MCTRSADAGTASSPVSMYSTALSSGLSDERRRVRSDGLAGGDDSSRRTRVMFSTDRDSSSSDLCGTGEVVVVIADAEEEEEEEEEYV